MSTRRKERGEGKRKMKKYQVLILTSNKHSYLRKSPSAVFLSRNIQSYSDSFKINSLAEACDVFFWFFKVIGKPCLHCLYI